MVSKQELRTVVKTEVKAIVEKDVKAIVKKEVKAIVEKDVKAIVKKEVKETIKIEIVPITNRLDNLETRFDSLETRFDNLESRFDKLDEKFDAVEEKSHRRDLVQEEILATQRILLEKADNQSRLEATFDMVAKMQKKHEESIDTISSVLKMHITNKDIHLS